MADDDIAGLSALGKLLDKLPARIQRNVLAGAVKAGADVLVAPTRAAAPVFSGRLEESIVSVKESASRSSKRLGDSALQVSAGIALTKPGRRYWHLSEFGTVKQAAKPWLRPTFAAYQGRVLDTMKQYAGKRIEREARKLAKETGAVK